MSGARKLVHSQVVCRTRETRCRGRDTRQQVVTQESHDEQSEAAKGTHRWT